MTKREQSKSDEAAADRKRLVDFCETPGFTPASDGYGTEKNARLRQLDALNKHQIDRRTPGFPSTFGKLGRRMARCAAEQAETGNEARARLLSPPIDRIAREAVAERVPDADRVPWWLQALILVCGAILLGSALGLALVKWVLMVAP